MVAVSRFFAITSAPWTTAPDLSVTVPWIEPVCASATAPINVTTKDSRKVILSFCIIPPRKTCPRQRHEGRCGPAYERNKNRWSHYWCNCATKTGHRYAHDVSTMG